jgi:hypoxanthine phosphoribosyltransferase
VDDFVSDSRETWSYLLQMVKYEWLPREKKEALCTMAT